jgi:Tol biopolymer transport system component
MKKELLIGLTFFMAFTFNCLSDPDEWPVLQGPYLGQKAPVDKAKIFLDGIISKYKEPEMCAAFTLDGKEFYFNAYYEDTWAIFVTKEVNGKWTKPEPLKFISDYTDRDFTMSPDGTKIYFGSNRPREEGGEKLKSLDIFFIERTQSGDWSEPKNIGAPINTDFGENYPSVARNGNLYFFSCRDDGLGGCDIYVSRFVDGRYNMPENLGSSINSEKNDWDAYIAPDESYIIFSSQDRDDSTGGQDLYISYRKKDGSWTQSKNMGLSVNSEFCEICPSVSLDGKYLFFTSRRRGQADILWITTDIITKLKPKELK